MRLFSSRPGYVDEVEGYVRIPYFDGSWTFEQMADNLVKIEYIGSLDPGGNIPNWMNNRVLVETPLYSLINLKERIDESR